MAAVPVGEGMIGGKTEERDGYGKGKRERGKGIAVMRSEWDLGETDM